MKTRELSDLVIRALAALETPDDLSADDKTALIEDLTIAAGKLRNASARTIN